MVRSLWTAATGMIAQQTNVDTIANNLANVNTGPCVSNTGRPSELVRVIPLFVESAHTKLPFLVYFVAG